MRRTRTAILAAALAAAIVGLATGSVRADVVIPADLPLNGDHPVHYQSLLDHVTSKNPAVDEIYLRRLHEHYRDLCAAEGVSMAAAVAQMVHETDYLRFSGVVRAVQYNFAGIGATGAGNPGHTFPDMRTGVAAHVQHIKAYASTEALETPLVDPRFHLVARGSAPTVAALTGRWATDSAYAHKLLAHIAILYDSPPVGADARPE